MSYIKKLIILSGSVAKGTLSVERSQGGAMMTVSIYDLPKIYSGEYKLAVVGDSVTYFSLGLGGRVNTSVAITETDFDNLQCAVLCDGKVCLYGTSGSQRLTAYEFTEKLRRNQFEQTTSHDKKDTIAQTEEFSYSKRDRDIRDYFIDIDKSVYQDERIAEVNYYPSNLYRVGEKITAPQEDARQVEPQEKSSQLDINEKVDEKTILSKIDLTLLNRIGRQKSIEPQSQRQTPPKEAQRYGSIKEMSQSEAASYAPRAQSLRASDIKESSQTAYESEWQKVKSHISAEKSKAEAAMTCAPSPQIQKLYRAAASTDKARVADSGERAAEPTPYLKVGEGGKTRKATFIEQISGQLSRIFKNNRHEENLEKLIPGSVWAVVDYDNKGLYYVIGNISDQIIGYGVPSKFSAVPPPEFDGFCEWMPINPALPQGDGFWMMYQDALTGESVKN